jgi:purine-binding chemotaxis protein CheW
MCRPFQKNTAGEKRMTDETIDDELWDDDDEDTQKDKYLTFHLADEEYGLDIACVTEIIGIQKITDVPNMPAFVKGVINLRGKVVPVMDVRRRFEIEDRDYDERTCIIVAEIKDTAVGLVVDEVSEVLDIPADRIEAPPRVGGQNEAGYIKGMGKVDDGVKILLDIDRLLYDEELQEIKEVDSDTGMV